MSIGSHTALYHLTCRVILQASVKYFDWYRQDSKLGSFHHLVSLVTGQQVSFEAGRQIRQELYKLCGTPYCPHAIKQTDLSTIKNLTPARIFTIKAIATAYLNGHHENIIDYSIIIKGVGSWTIKGAYILTETSYNQSLYEDAYIKKRLSEIHNHKMTLADCKDWFKIVPEDSRSIVSYFLWRVKPSGVEKLRYGCDLDQCDFL